MVITKDFSFEAAHMLSNYSGPCSNLHGHSYTGRITLSGPVDDDTGMILDFNRIKNVIQAYDHATLFSDEKIRDVAEEALLKWCQEWGMKHVIIKWFKCTAEHIAGQIGREVLECFPKEIRPQFQVQVSLKETASSEVVSINRWVNNDDEGDAA